MQRRSTMTQSGGEAESSDERSEIGSVFLQIT